MPPNDMEPNNPENSEGSIPIAKPVQSADFEYVGDHEPVHRPKRRRPPRPIHWFARCFLVVMAIGLIGVFCVAAWIDPYDGEGKPYSSATHTQLGLAPCNMMVMTGKPCPSCGMTTSFSLLIHGDLQASLQANWAGTLLALFWMALIPWGILSAIKGRLWMVRNGELTLAVCVGVLVLFMISRWVIVLLD